MAPLSATGVTGILLTFLVLTVGLATSDEEAQDKVSDTRPATSQPPSSKEVTRGLSLPRPGKRVIVYMGSRPWLSSMFGEASKSEYVVPSLTQGSSEDSERSDSSLSSKESQRAGHASLEEPVPVGSLFASETTSSKASSEEKVDLRTELDINKHPPLPLPPFSGARTEFRSKIIHPPERKVDSFLGQTGGNNAGLGDNKRAAVQEVAVGSPSPGLGTPKQQAFVDQNQNSRYFRFGTSSVPAVSNRGTFGIGQNDDEGSRADDTSSFGNDRFNQQRQTFNVQNRQTAAPVPPSPPTPPPPVSRFSFPTFQQEPAIFGNSSASRSGNSAEVGFQFQTSRAQDSAAQQQGDQDSFSNAPQRPAFQGDNRSTFRQFPPPPSSRPEAPPVPKARPIQGVAIQRSYQTLGNLQLTSRDDTVGIGLLSQSRPDTTPPKPQPPLGVPVQRSFQTFGDQQQTSREDNFGTGTLSTPQPETTPAKPQPPLGVAVQRSYQTLGNQQLSSREDTLGRAALASPEQPLRFTFQDAKPAQPVKPLQTPVQTSFLTFFGNSDSDTNQQQASSATTNSGESGRADDPRFNFRSSNFQTRPPRPPPQRPTPAFQTTFFQTPQRPSTPSAPLRNNFNQASRTPATARPNFQSNQGLAQGVFPVNRPAQASFSGNQRSQNTFGGNQRPEDDTQFTQARQQTSGGSQQRPQNTFQSNQRPQNTFQSNQRPQTSFQVTPRPSNSFQGNQRSPITFVSNQRPQNSFSTNGPSQNRASPNQRSEEQPRRQQPNFQNVPARPPSPQPPPAARNPPQDDNSNTNVNPQDRLEPFRNDFQIALRQRAFAASTATPPVDNDGGRRPASPAPRSNPATPKRKINRVVFIPGNFGVTPTRRPDPYRSKLPGLAGSDYPTYSEVPFTNFKCGEQAYPGMYADVEAGCQVFHSCDNNHREKSFLCPNGTIFKQELFTCDWWYNVNCDDSPNFFHLNAEMFTTRKPKVQESQDTDKRSGRSGSAGSRSF
ncbi:protein piccolo [Ixodes scapularis]|uniref:protein piccolo n=1 Tax=Ixodes scapularis TaxID=6945 RepID=UPI001C37FF04|nr:protein piccolo [Ixodes scapularis]